jgi:hypothetical protein
MTESTDLVRSISITNLLSQRESVRTSLETAREALASADQIICTMDAATPGSALYGGVAGLVLSNNDSFRFRLLHPDGVAQGMKSFDCLAWRHLMRESGILSFMDATARQAWTKSLEMGDAPELTRENIEATFSRLYADRGEMFERGVIACFKRLSWQYQTNLPQRFGKRIVLTGVCGYYGHQRADELDDLLRVLHVLDGKPEPDHRNGMRSLLHGTAASIFNRRRDTVENDYLSIRMFKNGNGHVTFRRPDLVEQMNRIIAKHYPGALPAPK